MKNFNRYLKKVVERIGRAAERQARIYNWYQDYNVIVNIVAPIVGGIIGGIIGALIGFSITGH
jgi:hypothetical protein